MLRVTTVSLREVFHGRRGFFLAAMLAAEFGGAMQGLAYATVLPVVARELDGFGLFGATLASGPIASVLMLSVTSAVLARVRPVQVLAIATVGYVVGALMTALAPAMIWVLAGTVVRGVAGGLIAGFGVGVIGALFDERERPRVLGLYAMIWLVPSLVGPLLNAGITEWVGWRWALAWPAVLVVSARIAMGRYVDLVPWDRSRELAHPGPGLLTALGLAAGAAGSAAPAPWGPVLLGGGVLASAVGTVVFLERTLAHRPLLRLFAPFTLVCAAFFGLYEVLSVIMLEGLGRTLVWSSAAVTGSLFAWALVGLKPRPHARPDVVVVGSVLILAGLAVITSAVLALEGTAAPVSVVAGGTIAGVGMGLAYPVLSSSLFDVPDSPRASTIGAASAFAETAGMAWAALVAGGIFSAAHLAGVEARPALGAALGPLVLVAAVAVVLSARRKGRGSADPAREDLDARA